MQRPIFDCSTKEGNGMSYICNDNLERLCYRDFLFKAILTHGYNCRHDLGMVKTLDSTLSLHFIRLDRGLGKLDEVDDSAD